MGWKNVNAVIDGKLYIGNMISAKSSRSLTENSITHILSVCTEHIPAEVPASGIVHARISVEDESTSNLLIHLPGAIRFIDQSIKEGGRVLVHCMQGLSRSATVVAAYLMQTRQVGASQAMDMVRQSREQIWINPGFQEQLVLFELCKYKPSMSNGIYVKWRQTIDRRARGS